MTSATIVTPPPADVDDVASLGWYEALVAAATPIDAPVLAPNPVNLITASRVNPDSAGTRWATGGAAYTPESGAPLGTFGICGEGGPVDLSDVADFAMAPPRTWRPYAVWAAVVCSTFGWQGVDWKARLDRLLDVALPKAVEHELWTGEVAQAEGYDTDPVNGSAGNTWLARTTATDVTPAGGPVSVRRGIAVLEQALADCGPGARGTIHLRPEATPDLTVIRRVGNTLLTARDTVVVPGAGYPNTDRAGAAASAGTTWLYATGRTDVRYTDPIYPVDPTTDGDWRGRVTTRDDNTIVLLGMREAVASWDGVCHFAVHATLDT